MVWVEPSPQSIVTVLVWMPPGLTIVPLTVTVPFSLMLDDESTRPGAANSGGRVADGDDGLREGGLAQGCRSRSRRSRSGPPTALV